MCAYTHSICVLYSIYRIVIFGNPKNIKDDHCHISSNTVPLTRFAHFLRQNNNIINNGISSRTGDSTQAFSPRVEWYTNKRKKGIDFTTMTLSGTAGLASTALLTQFSIYFYFFILEIVRHGFGFYACVQGHESRGILASFVRNHWKSDRRRSGETY